MDLEKYQLDAERNEQIKATLTDEFIESDEINEQLWYRPHEGSATCSAITGSIVGAIGGSLIGILALPGLGLLAAVGTAGTALATTIIGAGVGLIGGEVISVLTNSRSED